MLKNWHLPVAADKVGSTGSYAEGLLVRLKVQGWDQCFLLQTVKAVLEPVSEKNRVQHDFNTPTQHSNGEKNVTKCKQGAKPLVSMSLHTWGLRNWGTWARRLGWDELRGGTDGWGGGCCCRARACAAPLLPNTPLCIYTNTHKKFIRKQTSWGYAQSCHALILLV